MEQGHPPAGATDVPATDVPGTQITLHTVAERQRRLQQLRFSAPVTVSAAGESFVVPQTALPSTRKEYDQTDVGTEHAILRNEMAESILCLLGIAVDDVHWPDYLALALELKPWEEVLATFDEDVGVSAEDRLKLDTIRRIVALLHGSAGDAPSSLTDATTATTTTTTGDPCQLQLEQEFQIYALKRMMIKGSGVHDREDSGIHDRQSSAAEMSTVVGQEVHEEGEACAKNDDPAGK